MPANLQKSETVEYGKIDDVTLWIDKKELIIVYGRCIQIKRVHLKLK